MTRIGREHHEHLVPTALVGEQHGTLISEARTLSVVWLSTSKLPGLVGGELEVGLDAGRHLLLQVVAVRRGTPRRVSDRRRSTTVWPRRHLEGLAELGRRRR